MPVFYKDRFRPVLVTVIGWTLVIGFLILLSAVVGLVIWTVGYLANDTHKLILAVGFGGFFFIRELCFVVLKPKGEQP